MEWLAASPEERCEYDLSGNLLTPDCTVEKLCRNHKSFGAVTCVRDHYFELFDLEKNFGEKRFCPKETRTFPGVSKKFMPWQSLADAMDLRSNQGQRSPFNKIKVSQKFV